MLHGDILDEVLRMAPERQAQARAAIAEVEEQVRTQVSGLRS